MSVLADYLAEVRTKEATPKEGGSSLSTPPPTAIAPDAPTTDTPAPAQVEMRSPLRPTRFTPGPALDTNRRLKSILKESRDANAVATGASPANERSPLRAAKKLTFAMDGARPFAEFGNPKPQTDAATTALSPSGQRAVDKYRSNVTRLLGSESPLVDRNHYHHLAPLVRVTRKETSVQDDMIVRRPVDLLKEGQVAILDHKVQQNMAYCEALLGIPHRTSTDVIGDRLAKQVTEQRWQQHVKKEERAQSKLSSEDNLRHSPARKRQLESMKASSGLRFNLSSKLMTTQPIRGADVARARQEQREAAAALERLGKDPEVLRQHRLIKAIAEVERQGELYKRIIAEQTAEDEVRQKGHVGNKLSSEELIAQWREELTDRAETEEMEEERDRARSYRKALRVEREESRKALEILSGLTSVQLEDRRRKSEVVKAEPAKKRWRITRMGSVDTFPVPRWSSCPLQTLNGDVVVEELDTCIVNHVTWIHTTEGWIPVQVAFNGFSRTQLFAEAPEDEGEGVVSAMLDALDDAHENIIDAMTMCPPEQLKSQVEVKEMLKQMEFTRQSLRDLPDGRRDMIRRIWDSMQSNSKQRGVFNDDDA
ncbi:Hypothetical protein, putative [Bodo saltans]|uniref:Uncharacterized protein n=1 Tax=Bodo saltans TaxID=75058 RepID=A0A0S4IYV6_BODSA|nr:Hypothetical protein, putative [Bodo saltans]|eukprot:CUG23842.1 Hypothetical protein, putative [Bodo saltans]